MGTVEQTSSVCRGSRRRRARRAALAVAVAVTLLAPAAPGQATTTDEEGTGDARGFLQHYRWASYDWEVDAEMSGTVIIEGSRFVFPKLTVWMAGEEDAPSDRFSGTGTITDATISSPIAGLPLDPEHVVQPGPAMHTAFIKGWLGTGNFTRSAAGIHVVLTGTAEIDHGDRTLDGPATLVLDLTYPASVWPCYSQDGESTGMPCALVGTYTQTDDS